MPDPIKETDKEEAFKAIESGVQKWMDQKYAEFGKWTLRAVLAGLFALFVKLIFLFEWVKYK